MAPEFPEEDENREKDYLIAENPFLRTFVDYEPFTKREEWLGNVKAASSGPFDEISQSINAKTVEREIQTAVDSAKRNSLFVTDIADNDSAFVIRSIAALGFEMGSKEGVELFYGDIYQLLVNLQILRNTYEGAWLVRALLINSSELKDDFSDIPPEFRGFTFDLD